jgi:predicted ester cyclase
MTNWRDVECETLLNGGISPASASLLVAWAAMWNEGEFGQLDEWVAADFSFNRQRLGLDGLRASVANQRAAIAEFHIETTEALAAGDRSVLRLHWSGTHTGDYQTEIGLLAPTGRCFAIDGIEIYRIVDGRITEGFAAWDRLGMFQSLGVLPTPFLPSTT